MGETLEIKSKISLLKLSQDYEKFYKYPIVLARVDNQLYELSRSVKNDCKIEFVDITDPNGFRAFQRSILFLMVYSAKAILGKKTRVVVQHSINKNYYCDMPEIEITDELIDKIQDKMIEIVKEDLPIEKYSITIEEGIRLSEEFGLYDKIELLKYRRTSKINFYKLDWYYDYFYGPMVPRTGYLKKFHLQKNDTGFVLQFPLGENPFELTELKTLKKITNVFIESNHWAKILNVDTVSALNRQICNGKLGDIIRISEALHEKKVANIADIISNEKKNIVLVAGPSSSGKTTFSHRLYIQLRVLGLNPYVISLDDYFNSAKDAPLDEFGKPNYECVEHVDIRQVNEDLSKLLKGETIELPVYNFTTGLREYKGRFLKLNKDDVLIIEGIHALNEKLTSEIAKDYKFKIFISALTQLNIDDHNRIPTTDTRLVRRIVRDNRFRNTSADVTIGAWQSVMKGETLNIFPFQEEADAFFNSALVHEMCVLKQFAEPLLFQIHREKPQFAEARRLIKFLDSFLGVSSEHIPENSILREFIGGSCFDV